jgi:hypothetical protein
MLKWLGKIPNASSTDKCLEVLIMLYPGNVKKHSLSTHIYIVS